MSLESKAIAEIQTALKNNDTQKAASINDKCLTDLDSIQLNIAVTGESGSGKSTFVNAFRGIGDEDEGAAPTDVVETTMEPKAYTHPTYPNVTVWDLPGIGTTKFPADQYLERMEFEKFDFFIIVSSDRFRENDVTLAQAIKKMDKTFYFVRAKIDSNLDSEKMSKKKNYREEKTLQEIKENCTEGLKEQGVMDPQVFLVSNFDLQLYDFPALQETMERDLPSHKRDTLILVLPNNPKIIKKKKEVFWSRIKFHALSAFFPAVPLPGLSIIVDLVILVRVIQQYLSVFGLDEKSLKKLSSDTGKLLDELKAVLKSRCAGKDLTKKRLEEMILEMPQPEIGGVADVIQSILILGIPIVAQSSYDYIKMFLSQVLDSLAVDAENVLIKALDIQ